MKNEFEIREMSDEMRERLQASADRNFRSLDQEALARIQFSFEMEDSLLAGKVQKIVRTGLAGTERPGSISRLRKIAVRARAAAR